MRLVVVGAAGQGRDTEYLIRSINEAGERHEFVGYVVSDLNALGPHDSEVIGDETWLTEHSDAYDGIVLGIGSPNARLVVAARLSSLLPTKEWPTLIHPGARMDWSSGTVGRGVCISDGVIGTVHINIGDFALINPAVTLGHEGSIGPGCVMNHASGISGGTVLERGVLVGTGARVLQYRRVGEFARVGAGAVVTRDVEPGATVVGIPARPMLK